VSAAEPRQKKVIMSMLDEWRDEGRAQMLLKQLTARFGPVPAEVEALVLAAKQPTLDRWALRVLTAPSLQAVLGPARGRSAKRTTARRSGRLARV
jgi:hypothetical protein